jgi:GYF domain 2/Domain of unknown function (DUF4352)
MNGGPSTADWYYSKAGQQVGPLSWEQLLSLAQVGTLTPADFVWNPRLPQWTPAAQIPGLTTSAAVPGPQSSYAPVAQPGAQWAGAPPAGAYGVYPGQPAVYSAPRRRSWLVWAIPVAIVVLAALGLGLGFGLTRGDDGNGASVSNRTTTTEGDTPATTEALTDTTEAGAVTVTTAATATTAATVVTGGTGTLESPVPLGQAAQIGNWQVRVTEATSDATQDVLEYSSANDAPGSGSQYVMVRLEATNIGTESEDFYSIAMFYYVGSRGTVFGSSSSVAPDDLFQVGMTSPGGTASGNVIFVVDSDEVSGGSVKIENLYDSNEAPEYFAIH